jgi:uncharacterized membrane protein YfcA
MNAWMVFAGIIGAWVGMRLQRWLRERKKEG